MLNQPCIHTKKKLVWLNILSEEAYMQCKDILFEQMNQ